MRERHCRRPGLTPRSCTDQAPSRDQGQLGGAHGRRNDPIASPFHGMRCPPASPLFASWPWLLHTGCSLEAIDMTIHERNHERGYSRSKKSGWYAVLADPQMPAMSTVRDQAHKAMDRKLFMMKGFHHPGGSQTAFLTGLAHLYNLVPYQRRAQHAGQCGVEVEDGRVPTVDWMLNLQILISGGFQ